MITLDELEDVIDVVLANYNGEPHTGLGGRTPLEAMQFLLDKGEGLLRSLPVSQRSTLCLLQEAAVVPVCGNVRRSVRPHVNFAYSRYSSRLLSGMTGLIGQKLRIYYNVKDIRNVRAFLMNGEELGTLTAARPWCLTPHSLRTRQEIHKLIRQGKLRVREGEDPVGAWFAWKQKQARTHSADAASLARALSDRAMAHSALANPSEAVDVPLAAHSSNVPTTTVSSGSGFPAPVLTKIFTY
ncbi:hypothetical protein [Paraburkholderia youngii]|uniref:hypothetical protein n=1 Tax=Paraburkholderia youngii TaxID=2782701 RepID=UPI003D1E7D0D